MSVSVVTPTASVSAEDPLATGTTSSCISSINLGQDCGNSNWNFTTGIYTACCSGDIIDTTGFNSYPGYTLLLENLVCCPSQDPANDGPLLDETKGCIKHDGRPLSELLETSTEVAKPWTTTVAGQASTVQPECFWSQLSRGEEAPWIATSAISPGRSSRVISSSLSSLAASQASSSVSAAITSNTAISGDTTESGSGSAATTTVAPTGFAVAIAVPGWVALTFVLSLIALTV
ncbi:hypothetical protein T440DRAFT_302429 [Plenodomus tracheiphilus IPT5]|uniref:Uncharacterized protein n=1 Tax=Plenodomus tracheiphilus IPT5 TaxID=1408161 RepID=A0A6A7ARI5_9PLEO|nr:hypothetical protein T440DRAFT_302429 [Plenodomus tracheiphilus IPT5]